MAILPLLNRSFPGVGLARAGALLATASLALGVQAPAQAVCMGFAGDCAPSEWTVFVERNSSVDFSGAPGSVVLTSSDGDSGDGPFLATMQLPASVSGFVTFRFDYLTLDGEGSDDGGDPFDPFGYILNGSFVRLSPTGLSQGESFADTFTFDVVAGDTFGFYAASQDAEFGPSITTVSNFAYNVPGPLPVFGAATAFGYSRRLRKKLRLSGGTR